MKCSLITRDVLAMIGTTKVYSLFVKRFCLLLAISSFSIESFSKAEEFKKIFWYLLLVYCFLSAIADKRGWLAITIHRI